MAGTASGEKVCIVCQQDVSAKPRIKDAQGRYVCKECVERAKSAKPAGAPTKAAAAPAKSAAARSSAPADEGDPALAALLESATANMGAPCEACGSPMDRGAVLCARCGHNRETGKAVRTRVLAAPKEKRERAVRSGPMVDTSSFGSMFLMTVLVYAGAGALTFAQPETGLILTYIVMFVGGLGIYIRSVLAAWNDGNRGWATLLLATFFFGIGALLQLVYVFFVNERSGLKGAYAGAFVGAIVAVACIAAGASDVLQKFETKSTIIDPSAPVAAPAGGGS